MKITWDSKKAATNPKNHDGVTFEEAQHVLLDPNMHCHERTVVQKTNKDSSHWEWAVRGEF
jgi:uncharacterized DUF497 family protein